MRCLLIVAAVLALACETANGQFIYGPYNQLNAMQQQQMVYQQQRRAMREQVWWQQQQWLAQHPEAQQPAYYGYSEPVPQSNPFANNRWEFKRDPLRNDGRIIGNGPNNQEMRLEPGILKGEWRGEVKRRW
jgi:hypothetical protein